MKNITSYINEAAMPEKVIQAIRFGMKSGYIVGDDNVKYGISADNIFAIPADALDDNVTLQDFKDAVKKLLDDGVKFKYQTSDEWRKAGYKDPIND